MKDRVPKYQGRVKLKPVAGQQDTYDLTRADGAVNDGMPLCKQTLLTDETCDVYELNHQDGTPNDALQAVWGVGAVKTTTRQGLGDNWLLCNGDIVSTLEYPALADAMQSNPAFDWGGINPNVGTGMHWGTVHRINGKFILVGPGNAMEDGARRIYVAYAPSLDDVWTVSSFAASTGSDNNICVGMAYAFGKYNLFFYTNNGASGRYFRIATSVTPDGHWAVSETGSSVDPSDGVHFDNGALYWCGKKTNSSIDERSITYSTDGVTFTTKPLTDISASNIIHGIAYCNGYYAVLHRRSSSYYLSTYDSVDAANKISGFEIGQYNSGNGTIKFVNGKLVMTFGDYALYTEKTTVPTSKTDFIPLDITNPQHPGARWTEIGFDGGKYYWLAGFSICSRCLAVTEELKPPNWVEAPYYGGEGTYNTSFNPGSVLCEDGIIESPVSTIRRTSVNPVKIYAEDYEAAGWNPSDRRLPSLSPDKGYAFMRVK